jgi:hypothetical protein
MPVEWLNPSPTRRSYTRHMLRIVLVLLIATPALAAAPHSGVAGTRSMPELSDLALFACAAFGIWFVRSRLRARFRKDAAKD